ncbi:MAG: hypothetical protein ACPGJE_08380, partial [Wenzhouxiangellaceae bacterium]
MKILFPVALLGLIGSPLAAVEFSSSEIEHARELRQQALASDIGYEITADLTTRVGPRLAGSPGDAAAVEWATDKLKTLGFDRVWTEPATFPTWDREFERISIVAPVEQELVALAIGFSPATPESGIEAEVAMFDDLEALREADEDQVRDRIVFIRNRMERA